MVSAEPKSTSLICCADLKDFLDDSFKNGQLHDRPLTVGVEQEFFIESAGLPADLSQSPQFFEALRAAGWTGPTAGPPEALELRPPYSPGSVIKYEHFPYLLEVAFDYFSNLHGLAAVVEQVFGDLERAGRACHIDVRHRPFCSVSADHPLTLTPSARSRPLLAYRESLLRARGRTVPLELLNFSAVIAATQIHVGGIDWWSEPAIVERLYSFEPDLQSFAYRNWRSDDGQMGNPVCQRWQGYKALLGEYPLLGFPNLREWSKESWIAALLESPSLEIAVGEPLTFLKQVRDLQIIRPRLFGTLEFRADPAQDSPRSILVLAALRLAIAIAAVNGERVSGTMQQHRARWWRAADDRSSALQDVDGLRSILRQAGTWLEQRGLGEERYLAGLTDAPVVAQLEG